jgi:long-chain acyl-CoA synthetase
MELHNSIPEVLFEIAEKFPQKTALLYKKQGVYFPISYKELQEKIIQFSVGLHELGIQQHDKVAILSENRPEWVIADMAIMLIGAVCVPLHTTFNAEAIYNILNHCQAKIIVVSNGNLLNKILLNKKNLPHLQKILFLDKLAFAQKKAFGDSIISGEKIFAGQTESSHMFIKHSSVASIIYTSGTTGDPKGVVLTHQNFLSNIEAINKAIPVKEHDIFLSFLPLSHVLERTGGYYMPLLHGATIAYAESAAQLPHNLTEVSPTVLISVPRVFEKFHDAIWDKVNASSKFKKKIFLWALKQKRGTVLYAIANIIVFKKIRAQMGGKLRLVISGGASLNENLGKFFYKIGMLVLEGYGLTETSPVIAVNREDQFQFGAVGKVLEGTEVLISEEKEILVKGSNVTQGYFENPSATKAAFHNGWFCTGDLGFVDSQGFLTVIGRKKEMILLSGGKNIWPEPIENIVNDDKYISQSVVVGDKQKFVSALIVPDWREIEIFMKKNNLPMQDHESLVKNPQIINLFQDRIDQKINPKLSDVEKIKKFALLFQELSQEHNELTPTLKLRRHIITQHYKKLIEEVYET